MSTAFSDCFHEADREGGADFAALRLSHRQRRRRRQRRDSRLVRETLRGGYRSDSQGNRGRERLLRFQYSLEGSEFLALGMSIQQSSILLGLQPISLFVTHTQKIHPGNQTSRDTSCVDYSYAIEGFVSLHPVKEQRRALSPFRSLLRDTHHNHFFPHPPIRLQIFSHAFTRKRQSGEEGGQSNIMCCTGLVE